MANFTVNHVLANDPNSIGTPIAYVVDEKYSENIILTVSNVTGSDADKISTIQIYDDGVYIGQMNSGAFWEQNKNYSFSIKSTELSMATGYNQLTFRAFDADNNLLGEEYATIRTVAAPENFVHIKEVNYSFNDVEIVNDLRTHDFVMPNFGKTFSLAGTEIRWVDVINPLALSAELRFDQFGVYDGNDFTITNDARLACLIAGQEIKSFDLKDDGNNSVKVSYKDENKKWAGLFEGAELSAAFTHMKHDGLNFVPASDFSFSIENKESPEPDKREKPLFSKTVQTPYFVNCFITIEANKGGWKLEYQNNEIPEQGKREHFGEFSISKGLEVKAGVGVGFDKYKINLVEAGVYGSGEAKGSISVSNKDGWKGSLSLSLSAGLFLDALTLKVGGWDIKLASYKWEIASTDLTYNFIGGSITESGRDHSTHNKGAAAVNFFMKDGINCDQKGNEFTFSANLEADKLSYVFKAMERNDNLNYKVVLRYAEINADGTYGERKEEFVNNFNAGSCAVLQKKLTLDENKNYAYSFVLIPESQEESNLDFVSSSDVFYTKTTLTVDKITVKEPSADPNMTTFEDATFTVKLSRAVDYDIKLGWFTCTGGNATEGVDYKASEDVSDRTVVIKAGETEATFSVKVLGDTEDEADENFYVQMYALGDAADKVVFSSENLMADSDSNWGYSECIIKDSNSVGTAAVTVLDISGSVIGAIPYK